MTDNFRPVVNATSTSATSDITKPMTDNLKTRIAEAIRNNFQYKIVCSTNLVDTDKISQAVLDIVEPMIPKWQSMESAPKDEIDYGYDGVHTIRILAWDKLWSTTNNPVVAFWDDDHWQVEGRDDATTHFNPTHWMPLPT